MEGRVERALVRQGCCRLWKCRRTFCGAKEADIELLHTVVDKVHLVVGHEPVHSEKRSVSLPPWRTIERVPSPKSTYNFMTSVSIRRLLGELYRSEAHVSLDFLVFLGRILIIMTCLA